ncbi:chemotaxis protein CheA [Acidobacteria bacterium AH-259-A15]|nr:chemotaxis protein CheA [Acidobacteria bacterium AH-259-A15]
MKSKEKEYKRIFLSESREEIESLNQALLELEKDPAKSELLDEILRLIHTLKGNAAAMGYENINQLTHKIEDGFISIRNQAKSLTPALANILYRSFDTLGFLLDSAEDETISEQDITPFLKELSSLVGESKESIDRTPVKGWEVGGVELADTIKVPVHKLDQLLDLVGELVIDGSRIAQIYAEVEDAASKEVLAHFQHIVTDIQDSVMDLRMVPVASMFSKFQRLVRDLAHQEEKEVSLVLEGQETELDRTLLERLSDPILHIIRNAVDHGLESPQERKRAGKSPQGQIVLAARREQQKIIVEVGDNGRGIDIEQVKKKAIERGLVTQELLESWREEEILALISEPGFTLAKTATTVSGRGIGMDVVKRGVDSVSGQLLIRSDLAVGTTIRIEIPPSIAVIKAMLFEVDNETYALPLLNVNRIRVITEKDIHQISGAYVTSLEEETIPLLFLEDILQDGNGPRGKHRRNGKGEMNLIVAESGERTLAFIVGDLSNIQDIVIKPLKEPVSNLDYFSGVTILGSGELCLILDVAGILRKIQVKQLRGEKTNSYENTVH